MIQSLVSYIVQQLVCSSHPIPVSVVLTEQDSTTLYTISVELADKDRGKVIGRDGQTIKALSTFVGCLVPKDARIIIEFEPIAE